MTDPIEEAEALIAQWDRDEPHTVHVWPMRERFESLIAAARADRTALATCQEGLRVAVKMGDTLRTALAEAEAKIAAVTAERDEARRGTSEPWRQRDAAIARAQAAEAALALAMKAMPTDDEATMLHAVFDEMRHDGRGGHRATRIVDPWLARLATFRAAQKGGDDA